MTPIKKLAAKAEQFKKSVRKAEGHLRRLGNENDKERFVLLSRSLIIPYTVQIFLQQLVLL